MLINKCYIIVYVSLCMIIDKLWIKLMVIWYLMNIYVFKKYLLILRFNEEYLDFYEICNEI